MIVYPNAKINLGLNVVEKRSDGYHNLETVFYPIGVRDMLEIVELGDGEGDYEWQSSGIVVDCEPELNICIKALRMVQRERRLPRVGIHLHKNIPTGAGLGGGSADGAFVLKGLNDLFDLGLSREQLLQMASKLGADCAFFIDNIPAYATGIGDKLERFDVDLKGYYMTLIKPEVHVSTAEAYGGIVPKPSQRNVCDVLRTPIIEWRDVLNNDFEETIFKHHPEIGKVKELMYECGALYASMSGSGSAVFGIFKEKTEIESGITFEL